MTHFESGRCFVQKITDTVADSKISVANYFNCQRSRRRLEQVKNVNKVLVKNYTSPIDDNPFAGLTCLDGYAIYAADGHYQKAAAHDRHSNGKNYPVGHVFTVNLRNQTVDYLDITRPQDKKGHEIRLMKRVGKDTLRMGEPVEMKVLWVYDRAIIDFNQWYKWKRGSGIYVLTQAKAI